MVARYITNSYWIWRVFSPRYFICFLVVLLILPGFSSVFYAAGGHMTAQTQCNGKKRQTYYLVHYAINAGCERSRGGTLRKVRKSVW